MAAKVSILPQKGESPNNRQASASEFHTATWRGRRRTSGYDPAFCTFSRRGEIAVPRWGGWTPAGSPRSARSGRLYERGEASLSIEAAKKTADALGSVFGLPQRRRH